MAHLQPIESKCREGVCSSRATVRLFNSHNASLGEFCRKHGGLRLKSLEAEERMQFEKKAW